jgi:DNA adenine methylase
MPENTPKPATPIVKWVGGKRQLQQLLLSVFDQSGWNNSQGTYFEPFLGGGAMLFALMSDPKNRNNKARVADVNLSLLEIYRSLKSRSYQVFIRELVSLEEAFAKSVHKGVQLSFFNLRRDEFNRLKHRPSSRTVATQDKARLAALFLFLNKAGFNGLYRESRNGNFNVPFGKKARVNLYDEDNFKSVREVLLRTSIISGSYAKLLNSKSYAPKRGDLIYLDPPYEPLSDTSSFTNYNHSGFTFGDQEKLAQEAIRFAKTGCKVILSNSSASRLRTLYWAYEGFNIYEVQATRLVSAKASSRTSVTEIIVTNFPVKLEGLTLVPRPR